MGKEYRKRHGRRKHKRRSARKKKRVKRAKRHVSESAFRKRRRYAAQPLRGPADVLHHTKPAYVMLAELARQLLGPRYPPPNKITQQGPPFLSYDPWAQQRQTIQNEETRRVAAMRREAREQALRNAPLGDEYGELGI